MKFIILALSLALAGCAAAGAPRPVPPAGPAADGTPPHPLPEEEVESPPAPLEEGVDFVVFRGDGSPASLDDVVDAADTVEVVFFGEQHDDPVTHRAQALLLGRLYQSYHRIPDGPMVHPGAPGVDTP
ncbi:MAG: hypothetical protein P8188_20155, partial [Gemmatimonadota bacterium]